MKNIVVFFGGVSVEHDVSVITGVLTLNSVSKTYYNAVPVYIDGNGKWYTGEDLFDIDFYKSLNYRKLKRVSFVAGSNKMYAVKGKKLKELCVVSAGINCMHGKNGEDGSLAGYMKLCGIPLASPDIASSSVSMDKYITKTVMKGLGVKTLPCIFADGDYGAVVEEKLGYPLIVKPVDSGSSIGIKKAKDRSELTFAVNYAKRFAKKVIIEKCLENFTEINCAAYKNADGIIKTSECERPVGGGEILSFDDKYNSGGREFPADIPEEIAERIKKITRLVYSELGFTGIVRIDFLVKGKTVYLNEINSVPGSLAYYLFCDTLKDFGKMITETVCLAEKNFAAETSLQSKFPSSVLNLAGVKSSKRL